MVEYKKVGERVMKYPGANPEHHMGGGKTSKICLNVQLFFAHAPLHFPKFTIEQFSN